MNNRTAKITVKIPALITVMRNHRSLCMTYSLSGDRNGRHAGKCRGDACSPPPKHESNCAGDQREPTE
jgi:hypothetical protein